MLENHGLLVVERFAPPRSPSAGYTSSEVLNQYRGFDGIAWPGELMRDISLSNGLASLEDVERLLEYVVKTGRAEIDLVYCTNGEDISIGGFQFAGYDVGYYCSEYLHYSAILSEVLYGSSPEMVEYARSLNAQLLFATEARARDFLRTREAVLRTSADLERGDEELYVLQIFAVDRPWVSKPAFLSP